VKTKPFKYTQTDKLSEITRGAWAIIIGTHKGNYRNKQAD